MILKKQSKTVIYRKSSIKVRIRTCNIKELLCQLHITLINY